MRIRLIVITVAVLALGLLVYLLLRPTADLDHYGAAYATGFGPRAVDNGGGLPDRFVGTGTVIVVLSARNVRDHEVELSVPERTREALAGRGIEVSVRFRRLRGGGTFGDYRSVADLQRRTRTTMPPRADGEVVHVFRIPRCLPRNTWMSAEFGLETDGHDARVAISPSTDTRELSTYERVYDEMVGDIAIGGC